VRAWLNRILDVNQTVYQNGKKMKTLFWRSRLDAPVVGAFSSVFLCAHWHNRCIRCMLHYCGSSSSSHNQRCLQSILCSAVATTSPPRHSSKIASRLSQDSRLASFYAQKQLLLSARLSHRNSVCPSLHSSVTTRVDQSKTVQARITKSLSSAAWRILVSETVKLFHKFQGVTPNKGTI